MQVLIQLGSISSCFSENEPGNELTRSIPTPLRWDAIYHKKKDMQA